MSQKRQPEDGKPKSEGNFSEDKRRRTTFKDVVHQVMKINSVQNVLEPLIRRVVKEEVEMALKKHLVSMKRSNAKEMHSPASRNLQLQFLNNLSLPVFTGARIDGDDSALKIALVDTLNGKVVASGPESSAKVEIVVLEGDFDGDEQGNWTVEDFKSNIVRERQGKKPLLMGDVFLTLGEGIGLVGEILFTDNSSWTRSRRFKLGARVVDNIDGARVKEAKTEAFIVRDHRGELYKKHHPPSLTDEVWRLEKIGKDGAFHKRLFRENIKTVKDFLTLLTLDSPRLRNILGSGMSAKMWEVTVDHARTCILDRRAYLYCPNPQQNSGVVFNVVGQVMGLLSECQYVPADKLSETQKAEAHSLVISAYQHFENVYCFEDEASLLGRFSVNTSILSTPSLPATDICSRSNTMMSHGMGGFDYSQLNSPLPDIISVGDITGFDDFTLGSGENLNLQYGQNLVYPDQITNSLICGTDSFSQAFCDDDDLQFFDTDFHPQNPSLGSQADLHSAVGGFMQPRSTSLCKAQRRWTKLFSVLKWFSIRNVVAKRTRKEKLRDRT